MDIGYELIIEYLNNDIPSICQYKYDNSTKEFNHFNSIISNPEIDECFIICYNKVLNGSSKNFVYLEELNWLIEYACSFAITSGLLLQENIICHDRNKEITNENEAFMVYSEDKNNYFYEKFILGINEEIKLERITERTNKIMNKYSEQYYKDNISKIKSNNGDDILIIIYSLNKLKTAR